MNKDGLINKIHQNTNKHKIDIKTNLDDILEGIKDILKDGNKITLKGFGVFELVHKQARNITNPRTHEIMITKAQNTIKFKPSKELKESINDL